MTPRQLGHRAAAWGDPSTPPANVDEAGKMDFVLAFGAVEARRAQGRDPRGHGPMVPHLCERDVTKVCNCCGSCKTECWAEGVVIKVEKVRERAHGIVWRMLKTAARVIR
jgi:hypothetical protein